MKTGFEIQTDIYKLLSNNPLLMEGIGGKVYRQGLRPRDSQKEDLVVIFTTADAEQMQSGVVTLNLFVPYISIGANGVMYENIARCEELEILLQSVCDGMAVSTDYRFTLKDAIHTQRDDELKQSFVVARLSFRILNKSKNN